MFFILKEYLALLWAVYYVISEDAAQAITKEFQKVNWNLWETVQEISP